MIFFSPAYLWFLPLISLPVIIHLLAKRKSKLIDFPSLKFLKLLEQDALRKFNVKQLILLIIRTLMILLIILAFARPNLNLDKGFRFYTQAVDLMVIAIDNTASNRVDFDSMTGLWLKKLGTELEDKGFFVVFTGITDLEVKKSADEIQPEYANIYSGDFESRLAEQIDLEQYRQKSITWLGDGQDVLERLEGLAGWNKFLLWKPVFNDMGISSVELPTRGLRQGEEYQLRVGLEHALEEQEAQGLELAINESRQNQVVIDQGVNFIELKARVAEAGFQEGQLELGTDEFIYNNIRYFVLPAGGDIPVQIIRSRQSPDYWKVIKTAVKQVGLNFEIRIVDYSEIDNLNLSQGGTVIIEDASKLVDYSWDRFKAFLAQGGQLILFGDGGKRMRELLRFDSPIKEELNQFPFGLYLTQAAKHDLKFAPLESVISQNRLKVYKRFGTFTGELEETWIRFLDDQPFLGATSWQEGRTIWFNSEFGTIANNLPLLGMFPTLMLQLCQLQELKDQTDQYNAEIGDTLHFYPPVLESENIPFSIQRPDGTADYLSADSNYTVQYSATTIPGIYWLARGRQILQPVAINISTHEAQAHSRQYDFQDSELYVSEQQDELVVEVLGRNSGLALWPILLSILLLLWVVESYLSRIKSTWWQDD